MIQGKKKRWKIRKITFTQLWIKPLYHGLVIRFFLKLVYIKEWEWFPLPPVMVGIPAQNHRCVLLAVGEKLWPFFNRDAHSKGPLICYENYTRLYFKVGDSCNPIVGLFSERPYGHILILHVQSVSSLLHMYLGKRSFKQTLLRSKVNYLFFVVGGSGIESFIRWLFLAEDLSIYTFSLFFLFSSFFSLLLLSLRG